MILFVKSHYVAQPLEERVLMSINQHDRPQWDNGMKYVSLSVYPVTFFAPIAIWSDGYIRKDKDKMMNGYKSAITISAAIIISTSLKYAVHRDRPYITYKNDITRRDSTTGPYSFPSGHTTAAFATATSVSLSSRKWYIAIPSFAYAGLVAYSRMRLGVHYPGDVLGGIIIGVGSGLATWEIGRKINEKKKNKAMAEP